MNAAANEVPHPGLHVQHGSLLQMNSTQQGAQSSICLLGLTFDSPNLGVQALLDGSLRSILSSLPNANICVMDYGYHSFVRPIRVGSQTSDIQFINLRFSKKLYLSNNIAVLLFATMLLNYVPDAVKRYCISKNETLRRLSQIDVAAAISGGDSFSDIYGLGRLIYEALPQILVLMMGKKLVLLPQTLGPFKGRFARYIAAYIMRRATVICSRDEVGLKATEQLVGHRYANKVRFCHDVGVLVQPVNPASDELLQLQQSRKDGQRLIGFNVSGLLYAGGYTRNNMFRLKVNYLDIVQSVLTLLIEEMGAKVVLVPHVYAEPLIKSIESDQIACEAIVESLPTRLKQSVVLLRRAYTANEIKYIIGSCDAFIGSRMHSCIAALSQGVPAVAISYSDKFYGVMQTLGMTDLIADPRRMSLSEILAVISRTLDRQDELHRELKTSIPRIQAHVMTTFGAVLSECLGGEEGRPEVAVASVG